MKAIRMPFCIFILSIIFVDCKDENDTQFLVESPGAIYVDDSRLEYAEGDILWINIDAPKIQMDEISNTEIDIFALTGTIETYVGLSIFSADDVEPSPLVLDEDTIMIEKGSMHVQQSTEILAKAI